MDFSGKRPQLRGAVLPDTARDPSDPNDRVSDKALRWHFRQAVLFNMKETEAINWEFDLCHDNIGEIMAGPEPGERMELELASRLGVGKRVSLTTLSSIEE